MSEQFDPDARFSLALSDTALAIAKRSFRTARQRPCATPRPPARSRGWRYNALSCVGGGVLVPPPWRYISGMSTPQAGPEHLRIEHNPAMNRFEAKVDGGLAVLDYVRSGRTIVFTHTGVPRRSENRGIGTELVRTGLAYARAEGLEVVPQCSFVAAHVRRERT